MYVFLKITIFTYKKTLSEINCNLIFISIMYVNKTLKNLKKTNFILLHNYTYVVMACKIVDA